MALLERGSRCHGEFDEVEDQGILMSIEYSSAVGIMVVDKVAHLNKCMSRVMVELQETTALMDVDYTSLEVWFNKEVRKQREVEQKLMVAEDDCQNLRDEVQNLWGLFNNILFCLADVEVEVQDLRLFHAVVQHGQDNPIVFNENDKEVADLEDKVEILEEGEVRDGTVFPARGILVPIEDEEDPWEASRQVDRAEERAELMHSRLTMDDVAFREAMETEQVACIDLVPGYQPPPLFSD